jgi:hypothetical protein
MTQGVWFLSQILNPYIMVSLMPCQEIATYCLYVFTSLPKLRRWGVQLPDFWYWHGWPWGGHKASSEITVKPWSNKEDTGPATEDGTEWGFLFAVKLSLELKSCDQVADNHSLYWSIQDLKDEFLPQIICIYYLSYKLSLQISNM